MYTTEKPFECVKCGKSFKHKYRLKDHQIIHSTERPYKCTLCSSTFKRITDLIPHQQKHSNVRLFKCEWAKCEKSFKSKSALTQHQVTHTQQKSHKCSVCPLSFTLKGNLKRHEKTHFDNSPLYLCPNCPKKYRSDRGLKLHLRKYNSNADQQSFECIFCGKSYSANGPYLRHLLVHIGEKPYNCELCDTTFIASSERDNHIRRRHTLEKPYACGTCGYRCVTRGELKSHSGTHLSSVEAKRYSCVFCGRDFHATAYLYSHIRTHIREKSHSCFVCGMEFNSASNLNRHKRLLHRGVAE